MVHLPDDVFHSILCYCDDRIEQNQRILLAKCMAIIKHIRLSVEMTKKVPTLNAFCDYPIHLDALFMRGDYRSLDYLENWDKY